MKKLNISTIQQSNSYRETGFTLIELLIGLVIFSFLGIAAITLQKFLIESEEFSVKTVLTLQNANAGLRTLISELRNASVSDNGAFPIEEASSQQLTFYSNIDADAAIERVRYFLSGTEFKKGTIEPIGIPVTYPSENEVVATIAESISNASEPIFTYYNKDWPSDQTNNPLPSPVVLEQITFIKIKIKVNSTPTVPEREFVLEPAVQIRRLNQNL